MTIDRKKLEALHKAATPGDISTAERHTECETVECPACQGDGELDATDYCNFDGVALGVQFYGIGGQFGAHEALWSYLVGNIPSILAALAELDALRVKNERLREALSGFVNDLTGSLSNPVRVLTINHDALTQRIEQALAALQQKDKDDE